MIPSFQLSCSQRRRRQAEGGASLLEFALISIAMYLLFAGIIEMGRMVMASQVLNSAARAGARELALTPLPADATFDEALTDATVRERVYDPSKLVIDLDALAGADPPVTLDSYFATLPVVNRSLRPLMISETITTGGVTRHFLRYPGALLSDGVGGYRVMIPKIVSRDSAGVETISWMPVVTEARYDPNLASTGSFALDPPATGYSSPVRATVAMLIHFPFQASALSGFRPDSASWLNPNTLNFNAANDGGVALAPGAASPPGTLVTPDAPAGAYSGLYGLGRQYALGASVRPFRSLLSAQSLFRREVLQ